MEENKGYKYAEEGLTELDHDREGVDPAAEGIAFFGDQETAEQYGYVDRALKSRQIQFIALGGTIGTGLFLGIAESLANAGPLGILLGYSITGMFIFCMMQSLVRNSRLWNILDHSD